MKGSEILEIIKQHTGNLFVNVAGVYSIDTIKKLPYRHFAVVNTGASSTPGYHWFW